MSGRATAGLLAALATVGAADPGTAMSAPGGQSDAPAVVLVADCEREDAACAAIRAVAEQLARIPRRHRLLLRESRRAVEPEADALALIEVACTERDGGVAESAAGRSGDGGEPFRRAGNRLALARAAHGRPRVTPAWLVDAALRAGDAAGVDPRLGGTGGQLVARATLPWAPTAADRALEKGVPSVRLVAASPRDAARWAAALVRRLDALAARPAPDAQFVVLAGRVWTRRALYWAGGILWAVLVVTGRPGAWRRTDDATRARRGHLYLRGLPFRFAFLAALLWAPAPALALVGPAALLALPPPARGLRRTVAAVLAVSPVLLLSLVVGAVMAAGRALPRPPGPTALLIALALVAWGLQAGRARRPVGSPGSDGPA